jgi:Flp pilus assembly protein TadG
MKALFHRLKNWRDDSGTSAIEFGFIAPILILLCFAVYDVSDMSFRTSNMQTAVRAGIQYAMNGGEDLDQAKTIVNGAWSRKPADGVVDASATCKCAGNTQSCGSTCGQTMNKWITITATGTIGGNYYSTFQTKTETIRIK